MEQNGKILTYFQQHAWQFDRLYREEALPLNWFNHLVRHPFYRRYELTRAACGDVRGKRILDVGCGTFPYLGGWRAFQRRLRYRLEGCPIYFHSQDCMANHFAASGYGDWQFVGSWAVAFPTEPADALPLEFRGET